MNIYDKANELASLIKNSEEFLNYKKIKDNLFKDAGTKKLITDYKKLQFEAQAMYLSGKKVNDDLLAKIKNSGELLQFNPEITDFFTAEYKFNTLVSDIYKIIGETCEIDVNMFNE